MSLRCCGRGYGLRLAGRLLFLLLRLCCLLSELELVLTGRLQHLISGFLICGVVHRRAIEGLGEALERIGKAMVFCCAFTAATNIRWPALIWSTISLDNTCWT